MFMYYIIKLRRRNLNLYWKNALILFGLIGEQLNNSKKKTQQQKQQRQT